MATDGLRRGLIGPREVERLWERHLLNCAVLAELLPPSGDLADAGSGAGLPGIVLAILRPSMRVTLVDAALRRTTFLDETVAALGLSNVRVVRSRVEDLPPPPAFDVVVARALAPLERLAEWTVPLLRPGGRVLAVKGRSAEAELARARPALSRLGVTRAEIVHAGVGVVEPAATVVILGGAN